MPTRSTPTFAFESPARALESLLEAVRPVESERVRLARSPGRILAAPVLADRPSPPADVSAMDGFALRTSELNASVLPIAGEVRIGRAPPDLPRGACLRIVTGAGLPAGADAVIRIEDVTVTGDSITIDAEIARACGPGRNIRRAGENADSGTPVVAPGTAITPAAAAALAAVGAGHIEVHRALTLAILSTGDELVAGDGPISPYQIRDSNGPALISLFSGVPWIGELHHAHLPDDEPRLARAVSEALLRADAVILTGGVSAGHRDFVPSVVASQGARPVFHRLPQRPGMPILAAVTPDGRPVLGLPGNPVSVMVTARRLAWPAVARRAGLSRITPPPSVTVSNTDGAAIQLWWHRPVRLTGPGEAALVPSRGSGDLIATAGADGFIELPPGAHGPGPWPFYAWRP